MHQSVNSHCSLKRSTRDIRFILMEETEMVTNFLHQEIIEAKMLQDQVSVNIKVNSS